MPVRVTIWADLHGVSRITAQGHTGIGPRQRDVVCAAVSAALEVLARACEFRDPRPMGRVIREEGFMDIACTDPSRRSGFTTVAAPVVEVLRAIGRQNPETVLLLPAEGFSGHLTKASGGSCPQGDQVPCGDGDGQ